MIFNLHKNCTTTIKTLQTELNTCINKCTNFKNEITDLTTQLQEQKAIYHYQTMCLEDKIKQLEGKKPKLTSTMTTRMTYWKKRYEKLDKEFKELSTQIDYLNQIIKDRETVLYNTHQALTARDNSYDQMQRDYERLVKDLKEEIENLQKQTHKI